MLNVSGGTAIGCHVLAGSAIVQALGVALGIGVGGTLKLSAGGTAIDADFDEGLEQIFSGGTDIRGSIFEASQTIFAGGESDDAVLAIAAQTVSSGGFALRTVLKTIGEELVLAGGTSLQTSVLDRSLETLAGRAVGTLVESGGRINVSGGVASATIFRAAAPRPSARAARPSVPWSPADRKLSAAAALPAQPGSVTPVSITARKPFRPAAVRSAPW